MVHECLARGHHQREALLAQFHDCSSWVWGVFLVLLLRVNFSSLVDACFPLEAVKATRSRYRNRPRQSLLCPPQPLCLSHTDLHHFWNIPDTLCFGACARSFSPAWNSLPLDLIRFTVLLDSASPLCPNTISFQKPFLPTQLKRAAPSRHSPSLYPALLLKLITSRCQMHIDLLTFSLLCLLPT